MKDKIISMIRRGSELHFYKCSLPSYIRFRITRRTLGGTLVSIEGHFHGDCEEKTVIREIDKKYQELERNMLDGNYSEYAR